MAHPLDDALVLSDLGDGRYGGSVSPAYWNIAGPFGGITAAILLQAVMNHPQRRGRPVAQTVNFCAAITRDPFEITVRLMRDGRSTQHWSVELTQAEGVAATATLVTGPSRETWDHHPATPPQMPPAETLPVFQAPGWGGWPERYQMRFERGAPIPGVASPDAPGSAETRLYIRDEPPRPLDFAALAAIADSFILRLIQVRGDLGPSATATLTTWFLADEAELAAQADRPLIGRADARAFRHGFHDQSAELWSDTGILLAVSHQLVWFKA